MDSSEREIFYYLKTWGKEFVSAKEVCRRAGTKKQYNENNDWAKPILQSMTERGILESDALGRYRLKPTPKKHGAGRWVSPEIEKILKESGVKVEIQGDETAADEHYEQL
jgi:hypothetical protein